MFIVLKEHLTPGASQQQTCLRLTRIFPYINSENSNINIVGSDLQIPCRQLCSYHPWETGHGQGSEYMRTHHSPAHIRPAEVSLSLLFLGNAHLGKPSVFSPTPNPHPACIRRDYKVHGSLLLRFFCAITSPCTLRTCLGLSFPIYQMKESD